MNVFSTDLETTGLKPGIHGITEFATVFFSTTEPTPPKMFYRWLDPEGYVWSNYCLRLHAKWIDRVTERIAKKQWDGTDELKNPTICKSIEELGKHFTFWLNEIGEAPAGGTRPSLTATGKNFSSFDLQFLKLEGFPDVFRHRTKDWVPYYERKDDRMPPELAVCKARAMAEGCAGLVPDVAHNALDDALDVMKLVQWAERKRA